MHTPSLLFRVPQHKGNSTFGHPPPPLINQSAAGNRVELMMKYNSIYSYSISYYIISYHTIWHYNILLSYFIILHPLSTLKSVVRG